MKKCDWCQYSHLENGRLRCKLSMCVLGKREIRKMLDKVLQFCKEKQDFKAK